MCVHICNTKMNDCSYSFLSLAKNKKQSIKTALLDMEHATGIEPARLAWEAKVLPLNYACFL